MAHEFEGRTRFGRGWFSLMIHSLLDFRHLVCSQSSAVEATDDVESC